MYLGHLTATSLFVEIEWRIPREAITGAFSIGGGEGFHSVGRKSAQIILIFIQV